MKIILSRKGFDSQYGGKPSPILPDGRIITLPIPWKSDSLTYSDLKLNYGKYAHYSDLMNNLGIRLPDQHCHLDPDLDSSVYERHEGWKPLFGQILAAQSHLDKQGVGKGDIFLFFGRYNHTIMENGELRYDTKRHEFHMLFGYLQVGDIHRVDTEIVVPEWMGYHPHTNYEHRKTTKNTIYEARDRLSLNEKFPGAGLFRFSEDLVLTKPGYKITCWNLPKIFRNVNISYHKKSSWKDWYFESVSRGQEFVVGANPEIQQWVKELVEGK